MTIGHDVYDAQCVSAVVGMLGSLGLLGVAIRFPALRKDSERIILFTAASCFCYIAMKLLRAALWEAGTRGEGSFFGLHDSCYIEAIWGQFWVLAALAWSFLWVLDFVVRLYRPLLQVKSRLVVYHLFAWGQSLVAVIVMVVSGSVGARSDGSCWFHDSTKFVLLLAVPMSLYVLCALLSLVATRGVAEYGLAGARRARSILSGRHKAYVASFVLCWGMETFYWWASLASQPSVFVQQLHLILLNVLPASLLLWRLFDHSTRHLMFKRKSYTVAEWPFNVKQPLVVIDPETGNVDLWDAAEDPMSPMHQMTPTYTSPPMVPPSPRGSVSPRHSDVDSLASLTQPSPAAGMPRSSSANSLSTMSVSSSTRRRRSKHGRFSLTIFPDADLRRELATYLLSGLCQSMLDDGLAATGSHIHSPHVAARGGGRERATTAPGPMYEGEDAPSPLPRMGSRRASRVRRHSAVFSPSPLAGSGPRPPPRVPSVRSPPGAPAAPPRRPGLRVDTLKPPTTSPEAASPRASMGVILREASRTTNMQLLLDPSIAHDPAAYDITCPEEAFEFSTIQPWAFMPIRAASPHEDLARRVVAELAPVGLMAGALSLKVSAAGSGSFFIKSKSFMVKTISQSEVLTLLAALSAYAAHLAAHPDSLLCRIYGCFAVKPRNADRHFAVLMDNALPIPVPPTQLFDLKGSTVARAAAAGDDILKDEDFTRLRPEGLILPQDDRDVMLQNLAADVSFLQAAHLMDYSLLLAMYDTPSDLAGSTATVLYSEPPLLEAYVLSVIDFLQVYNMSKKMEHGLKTLRHSNLHLDISAVDSDQYATRFMAYMEVVLGKVPLSQRRSGSFNPHI